MYIYKFDNNIIDVYYFESARIIKYTISVYI